MSVSNRANTWDDYCLNIQRLITSRHFFYLFAACIPRAIASLANDERPYAYRTD